MVRKLLIALLLCLLCASAGMAEYYAVLIVGDEPNTAQYDTSYHNFPFDGFWNDCFLTWEMLYTFGWKDDNIFVLYGSGNDYEDQLGNSRYNAFDMYWNCGISQIVDYSAYREDVDSIFIWLAEGSSARNIPQMTENDFLLVYTVGHGTSNTLELKGPDSITPADLASLMNNCAYDKRVIFMQQCFSGIFVNNLANNSTFIMTAVGSGMYAYSCAADDQDPDPQDEKENDRFQDTLYYHHEECFYHLVNAVRLKTIVGNVFDDPTPDAQDVDGLSSLTEIWNWVSTRESYNPNWQNQHPQHADSGDIGSSTFLNIPPYPPTGLSGSVVDSLAVLTWNQNLEYDFDHYEIHRKTYDHTTEQYSDWSLLATTQDTTYTDSCFFPHYGSDADTAWYKIRAVDEADRVSDYSNIIKAPGEIQPESNTFNGAITCIASSVALNAHPNPFNTTTTFRFSLPEAAFVELNVYDLRGRAAAKLLKQWLPAGEHQTVFGGRDLPSGVYLYNLTADSQQISGKLVLIR